MVDEKLPDYPVWQYLHQTRANPAQDLLRQLVETKGGELAAIRNTPFRKSVEAEKVLAEDMAKYGFWHSVTNRKYQPLFKQGLNFEIDFYHPEHQIAVEVEKGEISNIWKNICKFAESPVVSHGVLLVPLVRQGQQTSTEFYQNTIKRLVHIERIFSFIDSLLIIGY